MTGSRHDSTLGMGKIVIGMRTAGMMNKQIFRHFQACESTISSLRTKIRQMDSVQASKVSEKSTVLTFSYRKA